jgi:hypothetical protein
LACSTRVVHALDPAATPTLSHVILLSRHAPRSPVASATLVAAFLAVTITARAGAQEARESPDARATRLVHGVVRDSAARPVGGASIELAGGFSRAQSDVDGRFTIRLPAGAARLTVRRLGFRASRVEVAPDATAEVAEGAVADVTDRAPLVIVLAAAPEQLAGVFVPGAPSGPMALVATRQTMTRAPSMVEPDALRALTYLPGVQQPNSGIARPYVAGAALDESLMTIDGHPLQSAMHVRGIGGGIATTALDRTEVLAHHVPVTVDTRIGGVIAMHSRRATGAREGEVAVSPLALSVAHVEPALLGRAEVLVAARVTYLDRLMNRVKPDYFGVDDNPVNDFQDGLVRVSLPAGSWRLEALAFTSSETEHQSSPRAPLRAEYLGGVTAERRTADAWTALRFSHNLATRAIGVYGTYPEDRALDLRQRLTTVSAERGRRFDARTTGSARIAVTDRDHAQRWDLPTELRDSGLPPRFDGEQALSVLSAAARVERRWTERWSGEVGAVAQHAGRGVHVAPRARLSWSPAPALDLHLSLERRHQFDGEFSAPLVLDAVVPVHLFSAPRRMDGVALSSEWRRAWRAGFALALRGDLYARRTAERPRGRPVGAESVMVTELTFDRIDGRAFGAGLGVSLTGPRGLALQLAYSASTTQERTAGLWHRAGWDRPHALTLLATLPRTWGWSLSTSIRRQSGLPVTPFLGILPTPGTVQPESLLGSKPLLGTPFAARLGTEMRVDVALRHGWRIGRVRGDVSLQVFNVTNAADPLEVGWLSFDGYAARPIVGSSGIGRIPTLGVSFRW